MSKFPVELSTRGGHRICVLSVSSNGLQFGIKCRNPDGTEHFPSLGLPGAGTGGRIDSARFKRCRFAFLRNPANTSFRLPGCAGAGSGHVAVPGCEHVSVHFPVSPDGWSGTGVWRYSTPFPPPVIFAQTVAERNAYRVSWLSVSHTHFSRIRDPTALRNACLYDRRCERHGAGRLPMPLRAPPMPARH